MFGIVCRPCAACQREIIARALALGAKLLRCLPHERMEPVHRAGDAAERMSDEVVTAYVRELVQKHRAPAIERPPVALRGKNYCRFEKPACKRHVRIFAAEKSRRLVEREPIGDFPERSEPVFG